MRGIGLLPFAVIVAHIAATIAAFFYLLPFVVLLALPPWDPNLPAPLAVGLAIAGLVLLAGLGRHLWQVVVGLLTSRYDQVPEIERGAALDRQEHPALYGIVDEVAVAVGIAPPDEIRVIFQPECYAAELRRFGVSTRRRLVVVLGLPHLAVLTAVELKVILAHEFAHIALGDTRLEVFAVRFLGVLRTKLDFLGERWWRWIDPLFYFYLGSYYLMLRIWAPMRRFQELRADRMSAFLYGGEPAARTLLKDWLVAHQFYATVAEVTGLGGAPGSGARVFARFADRWQDFSQSSHDYLERRLGEEERASSWDTHPTVRDRVAAMRAYPTQEPIDSRSVRELVPEFPRLAERAGS